MTEEDPPNVVLLLNSINEIIESLDLSECRTNEEYLKRILEELRETRVGIFIENVAEKSARLSRECRGRAAGLSELDPALEELTKSVASAPLESEELAEAYTARSAVLFKVRLMRDSLEDVDRALRIPDCPEDSRAALQLRRAVCLRTLDPQGSHLEVQGALAAAQDYASKLPSRQQTILRHRIAEQTQTQYLDRSKFLRWKPGKSPAKLRAENPMIPGLSDALELRHSAKFGRHVVATRNIGPGEVLAVQRPYAKIVNTEMRFKLCWDCAGQVWASLPCPGCRQVVFCSESCRERSRVEYHDLECSLLTCLVDLRTTESLFVGLRLTIMAWKEARGSLEVLMGTLKAQTSDPLTKGFINNILQPDKFASVYGLISHSLIELFEAECVAGAIVAASLLATRTNFMGERQLASDDGRFVFVIELILRNIQISNYNSFSIEGNTKSQKFRAIVPSASFFNHSCNQTMIRRFQGEFMTSTILHPVKKGEQVFDNYGVYYDQLSRDERRAELLSSYRFSCDCEPCKLDWPMIPPESPVALKNFRGFSRMALRFREIYNDFALVKRITKNHNCLPDVTQHLHDLVDIIEKFSKYFKINSAEIVNAMLLLDGLLSLAENRYYTLN